MKDASTETDYTIQEVQSDLTESEEIETRQLIVQEVAQELISDMSEKMREMEDESVSLFYQLSLIPRIQSRVI